MNIRERGKIHIGIEMPDKIVGVENIDSIMLQIKDRINNNVAPSAMRLFDVIEEEYKNKKVIKIIVTGGTEKSYYRKKYGINPNGCF